MKQKDVFLESEGNAWLRRNSKAIGARKLPDSDLVLKELLSLPGLTQGMRVLEIGCGDGARLGWLQENLGLECYGVDPSAEAVRAASARGIRAFQGTADRLDFDDRLFDIVIFGFCLYLCDREDLFRIASEADRVLADQAWLIILDFYSSSHSKREYHHRSGLFSYKMDYQTLFTWHPGYTCLTHRIRHHSEYCYTDDTSEWISTSVLRKKHIS